MVHLIADTWDTLWPKIGRNPGSAADCSHFWHLKPW